jgi:hypothetical protein
MADFDLALEINADGRQAVAEVDRTVASIDRLAGAQGTATEASRALESATAAATRQQVQASTAEAERARQLAEVAVREKAAATAARQTAEARLQSARSGTIQLTASNPTVTLSPGGGAASAAQAGAVADARELEVATRAVTAARLVEEQAERALADRLAASAAASQASQVAAAQLAQSTGTASAATEQLAREFGLTANAGQEAAQAARQTAAANVGEATAAQAAAASSERHGAAVAGEASQMDRAQREATELAAAETRLAAATTATEREAAAAAVAQARLQQAQTRNRQSTDQSTAAANRNSYAIRNVGQQFGDFGLSIAGGIDPARAFGQQAGQLGYALSEMSGTLGKVGAFLVGPWGIALTVGAAVLAPLLEKLLGVGEAAKTAQDALKGFAEYEGNVGNFIDKLTGKLIDQNRALVTNAILLKKKAGDDAAKASVDFGQKAFDAAGAVGTTFIAGGGTVAGATSQTLTDPKVQAAIAAARGSAVILAQNLNVLAQSDARYKSLAATVQDYAAKAAFSNKTMHDSRDAQTDLNTVLSGGSLLTKGAVDRQIALATANDAGSKAALRLADAQAKLNDIYAKGGSLRGQEKQIAAARDEVIAAQKQVDAIQSADKTRTGRTPRAKKGLNTDGLVNSATNDIASLTAQFTDAPTFIEKAQAAIRKLNADITELSKKKPPNFQSLIDQAEKAKGVIQANIAKPFDDFVRSQVQQLDVLKLQARGLNDQADALRIIQSLEKQLGPLTPARKDAILATVEALRAEQRQIDINKEHVALYTNALGSIKSVVEDATQAFVRGDLGQIIKSPAKLLNAFQSLQGQVLFDKLFGSAFRDLQDQINGTSTVADASARMSDAVDQVTQQTARTTSALSDLANASQGAAGALSGRSQAGLDTSATSDGNFHPIGDGNIDASNPGDIVVTGARTPKIVQSPTALFTSAIGQVGTKIAGLFTSADSAAKIGQNIGKFAGKGLEGAATGTAVAGVAKALGVKLNQTGAQLGGAVGSFLPIPGGQIIGSIVGGLAGKLFEPKAKPGGVTVSNVNGQASITGKVGGDAAGQKTGAGLASNISSGLNGIVQQLGGQLGAFSVQIGSYKNSLRVNENGKALGGVSGSGAYDFGDDQDAAVAKAIQLAIGQGAVKGLDEAVRKALTSSTDINAALQEALKVQQVELLIGGLGSTLKKTFADADAVAADRLRIAKQYGLDVVAVEKANAEERTKLIEDTLKASVGSLQDFLKNMTSGDLFEGSATDKRKAILDQIKTTKVDADAGKDGAADQLATLYQSLLQTSRESFGTAGGEYASDRALASTGATEVIKAEQDRINAAAGVQQATTDALNKGNTLANETNDLIAAQTTTIANLPSGIADALSGVKVTQSAAITTTARKSNLN